VRYSGRFVKESFTDKQEFQAGEIFRKSWTLRNDGETAWNMDTIFMQTNGDDLKASPEQLNVAVPANTEHVWTVKMQAPRNPGRYTAYFRMCTDGNIRFGHKVWCDILVVEPKPVVMAPNKEIKPYPKLDVHEEEVAGDKMISVSLQAQLDALKQSAQKTPKQRYAEDADKETDQDLK